jgi:molybdate transport system substrate-binding protein
VCGCGVDLAGPLPDELQQMTIFCAAVGLGASEPELARRFIAFVAAEAAAPTIMANGMERRPLNLAEPTEIGRGYSGSVA